MTFMFLRSSAALALLLGIASCASAPPPHANGAAGREYFPLLPGAHWLYELHTGPFSHTTLDVTARGERPVRGSETGIFVVEERAAGQLFGLEPSGLVGYRVADGYMTRVPALELGADGVVRVFGRDGVMVLPVDPQPGQRWTDQVAVFDNTPGESAQSWTARIENVGRLHVPAGTFDDVIVVRSEQWDRGWRENEPLHSYEDYYARGVGLIRSVAHNHTRWLPIAEIEQELVEVSFDAGAGAAVAR
ncbi:MAG TPA: hypothetical protein VKF60_08505 [Myxococcota bacterium]|nr:hypothetical protein [Myxococcota bacterium]